MEIIIIEKETFTLLLESVRALSRKVHQLEEKSTDRHLKKWLDSEDVCRILRISPRALQTLRDTRRIPCAQVNRKFFYKPEDIEKLLDWSSYAENESPHRLQNIGKPVRLNLKSNLTERRRHE